MPVNARSCKHLRQLLGDAYEDARLALKNPDGFKPQSKSGGKKPATRSKKAAGADADDDDADDAPAGKKQPDLLLANKWDVESGPDPTGWWISEKLDGVRCVGGRWCLTGRGCNGRGLGRTTTESG